MMLNIKRWLLRKIIRVIRFITPIKSNRILFSNFNGMGYGCNPKYICQEILERNTNYELIWLVKKDKIDNLSEFPDNIKLINYKSLTKYFYIASSKIWILNTLSNNLRMRKKKKQLYIQTGHGSFGIKKVGLDSNILSPKKIREIERDSNDNDYFVSNSKFESDIFRRAFKYKKILEYGHARNDILINKKESIKLKVYQHYNIPLNKKIAIYLPTFRSDNRTDCFYLDISKIKKELETKFSSEFVFIIRLHPRIKVSTEELFKKDEFIDGSYYNDIQELLLASQIAITDYSSCIFDFILQRKPAFIFAKDIDNFIDDQGFYYSIKDTPIPLSISNGELINNIRNFDIEKYKSDLDHFFKNKVSYENGKASMKIVDFIIDKIGF